MLHSLLGFHTDILKETPLSEQSGYRMVSILFAAVCLSMVAADAFFGHMFHSGWLAIILSGHFLGYIHFAVYRLALITLTTRPLHLLSVLRHGSGMEYTRKLAIHHRSLVERDFYTNLLEAQQELSADFATSISLKDAHVYEDPPFNTKLKVLPKRKFGGREDFTSYLQSL